MRDAKDRMRTVLTAALLLPAMMMGCKDDDGTPSLAFCESELEVSFDPVNGLLLPFPSDLYLAADASTPSGYRVNITDQNLPKGEPLFAGYSAEQEQLNQLDGFGTTAAITFGFSGEIGVPKQNPGPEELMAADPPPSLVLSPDATTATSSPVVLIGIHEGAADEGRAIPLLVEYLSGVAADGTGQHYLLAEPAYPLLPETTYALALTRRLTDAQGACVAPSEATRRLLGGAEPEAFGRLGELAPRAIGKLVELGFITDAGDLSGLTVFTTQSTTDELVGAAAAIQQQAVADPPTVIAGSITAEASSGGVALEVYGKFSSTSYLGPEGTFVVQDGLPVAQGTEEIEFQLMVPEATAEHQPPFPLIIYQHGLLGTKKEDGGAKRAHARAGFATVSIDAVAHGSRMWDNGVWSLANFFSIDFNDGKFNIPRMRDNFRQTYLDVVQLAELAPALAALDLVPDGAPDGVPEIAASPLYITGHSLGGLMSSAEAALIPDVRIGAFNAGGGGMLNMIRRSELFGNFIIMLKPEEATMAEVYRFMPILQTLAERGDPLNFSRLVIDEPPAELEGSAAKHVLFQAVEADTFVPNHCNEAIARGLAMAHLKPVVHSVFGLAPTDEPVSLNHPAGVTSVFFQFDYLEENGELVKAEHTASYGDRIPQEQWIHFFETFRDTGAPEVLDPYRVLGIVRP